jgi:DNA primase
MSSVDIKFVRDNVDIVKVAEYLGLKLTKKMLSEQMRVECPVSGGGPRALVITPSMGRYYCFAPECREGGDSVHLAAKILKIPARDAALQLQSKFLNATYKPDFSPQEKLSKVHEKLEWQHEEVQKLGLTPEQAQKLSIGWMAGGTMPKRLLLAVRTREGVVIGYVGIPAGTDLKAPKTWYHE